MNNLEKFMQEYESQAKTNMFKIRSYPPNMTVSLLSTRLRYNLVNNKRVQLTPTVMRTCKALGIEVSIIEIRKYVKGYNQ